MDQERQERIRYYTFAAFVGILLLLNVTGIWKTIFGIDTAAIITLLAGYKTFHNSISSLLERRISADIALCIAVIAALSVGEYLAGFGDRGHGRDPEGGRPATRIGCGGR